MQGVTAEYGPARAQKNQTGKWYPQIPVDHTTLQINQRVVNTTLIPVKVEHCARKQHKHPYAGEPMAFFSLREGDARPSCNEGCWPPRRTPSARQRTAANTEKNAIGSPAYGGQHRPALREGDARLRHPVVSVATAAPRTGRLPYDVVSMRVRVARQGCLCVKNCEL